MLFTSAGRRVELMQCFRADAEAMGVKLRCLAADREPAMSPACHRADAAFAMPGITDGEGYMDALLSVCRREEVDLVLPLFDAELHLLARSRDAFAQQGTHVAISDPEFVASCRNKLQTVRLLQTHGVPCPATEPLDRLRANPGLLPPPVVIKPIDGSGSKGVRVIHDPREIADHASEPSEWIAQEWLPGKEYTVNIFVDRGGLVRSAVPHLRMEVRHGEVSKAVTVQSSLLDELVRQVTPALAGARGPICFQVRLTEHGQPQVFEINARFGGGFPLAHRAGGRFPLWLMQECMGIEPEWEDEAWKEGVVMLRYDQSVFVDP